MRRWRFRRTLLLISILIAAWSVWGAVTGPPGFNRIEAFADGEVPLPSGAVFIGEVQQGVEPPCLAGGWCTSPAVNRYYAVHDAEAAIEEVSAELAERASWSRVADDSTPSWDHGVFDLSIWAAPDGDLPVPLVNEVPAGDQVLVFHIGGQYD